MTIQNGLIFQGNRVVIPRAMRDTMVKKIHSSHIGINGCLRRAREALFWPGMSVHLKQHIQKCEICNEKPQANAPETLMPHEIPDRPWAKVGVDLFTKFNNDYLITVDYFSGFFEIDHLRKTTATTVITKLKNHFARYGIPEQLVSDNGPQFSCAEFAQFLQHWDCEHTPSSPGNSQANGKAEAAVKVAKNLIHKAVRAKSDIYMALLDFRNTPSPGYESSPAQRTFGRRCRTMLPTAGQLLTQNAINLDNSTVLLNHQDKIRNG